MGSFSPVLKYEKKELVELPPAIFQGNQTIYYPGAQTDTSIIKVARVSLPPDQFGRIKFVYQDPFYDKAEINKSRRRGYPFEWSHENLNRFLEEIKDENVKLIPTMVEGNDLVDKADFIYSRGLPLYGDNFPFNIMSNAKSGTYLIGSNLNLDELSFLFLGVERISENIRLVKNPAELSKYGNLYQISPELCELMFEYQHNTRGYMADGTIEMDISPEELEKAMREGKAVVTNTKVDLEAKLKRGIEKMDEPSLKQVQGLLVGEKVPKMLAEKIFP